MNPRLTSREWKLYKGMTNLNNNELDTVLLAWNKFIRETFIYVRISKIQNNITFLFYF